MSNNAPYISLGSKDGFYYFYLKKEGEIFKTATFTLVHLLNLDVRSNWQKKFPDRDYKKPTAQRFNLPDAIDNLIAEAKKIGLFDPNKVRGNGAWRDEGRIVINCGNFLLVDGEKIEPANFKSKFFYVKSLKEMPELKESLTSSDAQLILDTAKLFKWSRPCDPYFLVGWLMLAPIAGALPVRPHIWLTGAKGMGKSTVLEFFVMKLLGDIAINGIGSSTEAGIRQASQHNAQPFTHDEFEVVDQKSSERIGRLIELLRNCWSDTGARTYKGTTNGTHISYNAKLIAFVSGINVYLPTEADRSRFTVLELLNHSEIALERVRDNETIHEHLNQILPNWSERLYTRSVNMIKPIIASYEVLAKVVGSSMTSRDGQQLGMLLAGFWALGHNNIISKEEAQMLFAKMSSGMGIDKEVNEAISDEEECLNLLMTQKIRFARDDSDDFKEDLIGNMIHDLACASTLLQLGIKVDPASDTFAVAYHHSELSKIYRGTRWEKSGAWVRPLSRIPGAKRQSMSTFGSRTIKEKSIAIPRDYDREGEVKKGHLCLVNEEPPF
jgi:putative DNA primase/helicase